MRTRLSLPLAVLIVLVTARAAFATSFGYEYLISTSASTAPLSDGTLITFGGGTQGAIPATTLASSLNASTFAGALGAGMADAFASALGSNGTIGTRLQVDGQGGISDAHSLINYWEGFVMTSPDGSVPVGGSASYTFNGSLTFGGTCSGSDTLAISLKIDGTVVQAGNACQSMSYVITGTVGQEMQLVWTLDGDLSGSGANYFKTLDASHTLTPFINPNGPGLGYTTASGRSYVGTPGVAPVPEPATLTLLGSGVATLLGLRRRKRR